MVCHLSEIFAYFVNLFCGLAAETLPPCSVWGLGRNGTEKALKP
jgi:hypothetical protein